MNIAIIFCMSSYYRISLVFACVIKILNNFITAKVYVFEFEGVWRSIKITSLILLSKLSSLAL